MGMIRGTTPTFEITVSGIELATARSIHVTLLQPGGKAMDFSGPSISIEGDVISVFLAQNRTLGLKSGIPLQIQVNGLDAVGSRWASEIVEINVTPQLLNEVIS